MDSKTPQIISHNYIKIIGQNIKTSRTLKFENQVIPKGIKTNYFAPTKKTHIQYKTRKTIKSNQ